MIKNIVFDIGGVLVDYVPEKALRNIGIQEELVTPLMNATVRSYLWPELDRGFIPEKVIVDCMMEENPEMAPLIQFFFDKGLNGLVEAFPHSAEWLEDLKKRDYGIFLLTNYPQNLFELHWKNKFTFTRFVDGKVVSGEVHKLKPDQAIYQCLFDTYGLKAEECVFIDDRKENVLAAKYMGMNGLQFSNYEDTRYMLENMLQK